METCNRWCLDAEAAAIGELKSLPMAAVMTEDRYGLPKRKAPDCAGTDRLRDLLKGREATADGGGRALGHALGSVTPASIRRGLTKRSGRPHGSSSPLMVRRSGS